MGGPVAAAASTTNGIKLGMIQGQAPSAVLGLALWQLWADEDSKSRQPCWDRLMPYLLQPRFQLIDYIMFVPFVECVG
jgi:hypothetical protein